MTVEVKYKYREEWLTELGEMINPLFSPWVLRPYRLTCGWPSSGGLSPKKRTVGQCHGSRGVDNSDTFEIFISPLLDDSLEVGGTVCHEIAHVAAGLKARHGEYFQRVCRYVGITKGKPTSAMPGSKLNDKLSKYVEQLGPYPHVKIQPQMKLKENNRPKMLKLECSCGCKVNMSEKWFIQSGCPTCGCGKPFIKSEMEES